MIYTNLEQRMAQSYIDLFPKFIPDENAPVSVEEQKHFYDLMNNLYQLAFSEPLLFVPSLHEDDAYPHRYKKAYGKPQLITDMRKFTRSLDSLIQKMFLMGQENKELLSNRLDDFHSQNLTDLSLAGNNHPDDTNIIPKVKLNKREQVILSRIGINDFVNLPAAWIWMSARDHASLPAYKYCLFKEGYSYASEIYSHLLDDEEAFEKLENWMLENGYKLFDIYDTTASDCKLSLTIANPKWSKDQPRGGCEYKIKHTGISVMHDFYVENPVVLGLCIPNGLKSYLEAFGSMDHELQQFVVNQTKKCDSCRYCVQTDKTGSRPLAYIPITFDEEDYQLCPYFPGYNYSWSSINDKLVEKLIKMLAFMDTFVLGDMS